MDSLSNKEETFAEEEKQQDPLDGVDKEVTETATSELEANLEGNEPSILKTKELDEKTEKTGVENFMESSEELDKALLTLIEDVDKQEKNQSLHDIAESKSEELKIEEQQSDETKIPEDKIIEAENVQDEKENKRTDTSIDELIAKLSEHAEPQQSEKETNEEKLEEKSLSTASDDKSLNDEADEKMNVSEHSESEKIDEIDMKEPEQAKPETSNDGVEAAALDAEETLQPTNHSSPEKLIDMLKLLTPEKIEIIKSQILTSYQDVKESTTSEIKTESHKAVDMEIDETISGTKEESVVKAEIAKKEETQDNDCIILLDSDEEDTPASKVCETKKEKNDIQSETLKKLLIGNSKRKSDEDKENEKKLIKRSKECVNPECLGGNSNFVECDRFILNFFFVVKKENRIQYVCSICHEQAITKYEEMATALLNNEPLVSIKIHKKQDMIEVIDSDDEYEPDEIPIVPDSEKIRFDPTDEKLAEEILQSIYNKIDMKKQIKSAEDDFKVRCDKVDQAHLKLQQQLRNMDRRSQTMYNALYSINKPRVRQLPPVMIPHASDVQSLLIKPKPLINKAAVQAAVESLQKNQSVVLQRANTSTSPGKPNSIQKVVIFPQKQATEANCYYANRYPKNTKMHPWSPCQKLESFAATKMYKVKFFDGYPNDILHVRGKDFALNTINHKLQIGARVVAELPNSNKTSKYFPGVIGEKLTNYNNHRYLVFCDYGQVHYVKPECVREVADMSANVWEDVHQNLEAFIRDYLMSQTARQRALLNVRKGQYVTTERNGGFRTAQVIEIDCSIVQMYFVHEGVHEWLYRGSKRLQPIFNQESNRHLSMNARRVNPNISYTTIDDEDSQQAATQSSTQPIAPPESSRNIAKKSTAPGRQQPAPTQYQGPNQIAVKILNDTQIYLDEPRKVTKFKHFTPKASIKAGKYVEHKCSPDCLPPQTNSLANYSPLSKPLLTCWERLIVRQKATRTVMYKAPCGRRLRDMYEVRMYLLLTKCFLNVDNFDFDPMIQVLCSYEVIDKSLCPLYIPDMTEGKEGMKIPVINAFDDQPPPHLKYSNVRIPMQGVAINTDVEFMACCDCTDDCADKNKCACFQMTIQGFKFANRGIDYDEGEVSYRWKRLPMQVPTAIYECHKGCHCTSRCLNKVVQLPIQIKMQLYRTKDRGWGLECNHDIPKGTFICIYAGHLLREDDANALATGTDHGDEYYAELDLIETASQIKEGYEAGVEYGSDSDASNASDSDSDYDHSKDDDDTSFAATAPKNVGGRAITTRSTGGVNRNPSQRNRESNESDSDGEIVNMEPAVGNPTGKSRISLRRLFGKNEKPYVMDARTVGNVGRYFNHSCDPNLFVQSVFVDTHDMRFPWIAFFANRAIKAGEELTWNYNYEVGSVPSKMLHCKCGSKNCRGRIL